MNLPATASTRSLSRRLVRVTAAILLLLLATLAWAGSRLLRDRVLRHSNTGLLQAAEEAALIIDRVVAERERQVRLLASLPSVVDAARAGSALAARVGLPDLTLEEAERRFEAARTLDVDPRTRRFLLDRAASLDLAEVLVTDRNGFNAITTERTSDFVQSDEAWWQEAMRTGMSRAVAAYDESAKRVSISVASAVREGDSTAALGVLKVVYGLAALQEAVRAAGNQGAIAVEVVDSAGRVIASSVTAPDLKPLPGQQEIPKTGADQVVRYQAEGNQRAAVRMTNASAWRVVAHTPEELVSTELRQANLVLGLAALGVFMLLLGVLAAMNTFMTRRIAAPAAALAAAAESVAGGDLSVRLMESTADDEIGRLSRATSAMIGGLRNLTVAIKSSASETAAMALDLTASSEEMAASSQQVAQTASDLSRQSADMSRTIQEMAADSRRMVELSTALAGGASEGVQRNQRLRGLARENRERLNASGRQLEALVEEARQGVAASEALTAASQEIRTFVELIQSMARQSKLLAFSASMEASRAGQQGAGFAVVAKEVQRLADGSSEAAERTEKVVKALLAKVEESRASSARSAAAVAGVRAATQEGLQSFGQVESAVADTEVWTTAIEQASITSSGVVGDTTRRLDALSHGTEVFAAAMQDVAAAAEEQSASTEEVVATATALAATAERLTAQAGAFRLGG
jgi:methyl-accepting chemotaxis protein